MKIVSDSAIQALFDRIKTADQIVVCSGFPRQFERAYYPSSWSALTNYNAGDLVRPTAWNGFIYKCITAGTSGSGEPTWATNDGDLTNDGTVVWKAYTNFALAADGVSTSDFTTSTYPSKWLPSHSYSINDLVIPTGMIPGGFVFQCVSAGTSGDSEPNWVFANNQEITDGTVTWKCMEVALNSPQYPKAKLSINDKTNMLIHHTGAAVCIALLNSQAKEILLVIPTITTQNLIQGYTVDIDFAESVYDINYLA